MDTLVSIRVFVKIVEFGSLTAAAADMNISPAMASKHLKNLESIVEARLLQRTTRRLRLTEEGRLHHKHYQAALSEIDEVKQILGASKEVPNGTLRVAAPYMIGEAYLRPVVATYITLYPQMKLDISFSDGLQDIVEDGFDLALRLDGTLPASVIARRLAAIPQVVVASPDYLARHARPVRPQDLTPHMTLAAASTGGTLSFGVEDEKIEVNLERYLLLDSRFACQLALDGLGIAILPLDMLEDHLARGRLELLLTDYQLPERHLHVIYPSRRHLPTKVRIFIDLLIETTKSSAAGATRRGAVSPLRQPVTMPYQDPIVPLEWTAA
jgi:DNA-binding transcriptional LysR family regulator